MSVTWEKMEKLPNHVQQKLQALYSELFPIEVRFVLSEWLESMNSINSWEEMDPDNPHHEDFLMNNILPALFSELKKKAACSGMDIKFRLNLGLQKMEQTYSQNPLHLIRVIRQCLSEEANIVREFENVSTVCP